MRLTQRLALVLAAAFCLILPGFSHQTVTADPYMAVLETDLKGVAVGKSTTLDILVMDAMSMAPISGLALTASLSMPAMADMALPAPKVSPGMEAGHYNVQTAFPQPGEYRLDLKVKSAAGKSAILSFKITPGMAAGGDMKDMKDKPATPGMQMPRKQMPGMDMPGMTMKAIYGHWSANREGSGTSWQPDSFPMFMKMLPAMGGFDVGMMGTVQGGYVDAGGKRGDQGLFSDSMIMLTGRKEVASGIFGLHVMTSLDPILNGKRGVPNLFQNGFDVNGSPVGDRKDPHNIFAEVAVSYARPLSKDWSGFIYGGPVGEPALGNVMYYHRPSGLEIPEAPISHDWFDGTHISFGVATLGLVYRDQWKLEGSVFNGHDPVNVWGIGPVALNSASARLSYNPSRNWSFSTSYGYLNSDANEHRLTLSAAYSHEYANGDNLSATAYLGQNIVHGSTNSNAWVAEATYYHGKDGFFARFERVDKDELVNVPPGTYTINKLLFGDVHNFGSKDQLDFGLGAYAGVYSFPSSLEASYGKSPLTFGIFLRIRPSKG